ncbi:BTB/POZ and MATH domain-containing protein 1-like [Syzygium oleosum]|uniref:BTB/POZ and MATH domain-containing protein 1-like n=1 Tax=Syzygium oleosum TaxID=219896 RepID=UPI0011D22D95|nr:BTB/POZ and MATH domain-containing protein 1-like [Syzygium oleosum]
MTPPPMTARHDECDSRTVFETVNGSYTFVITNFLEAQSRGVGQRGVRRRALFELRLEDQNGNGNHQSWVTLYAFKLILIDMRSLVLCYCRGYPRFLKRDHPEALHYIKDDRLILHCIVGVVKAKVEGPRHCRVTISRSDVGQGLKALLKNGSSSLVGQRPDRETIDEQEDAVLEGLWKSPEKIMLGSSL